MSYLITQIILYLIVALLLGLALGWLSGAAGYRRWLKNVLI